MSKSSIVVNEYSEIERKLLLQLLLFFRFLTQNNDNEQKKETQNGEGKKIIEN